MIRSTNKSITELAKYYANRLITVGVITICVRILRNVFPIYLIIIIEVILYYGGVSMQFYYGDQNYLRILDEVEFWKHQEAEHTVVIREIIDNLDSTVVNQLQAFQNEFTQTEQKAIQLMETVIRSKGQINHMMTQHIMDFIQYAIQESELFVQYLNELKTVDYIGDNTVGVTVINHIIRESQYFIGIAQTIIYKG
ncbi:MAG TPA: DUF2935 domain-containing protein [Clostridiales bacterium]|nr:DUF2935 domain-containing protein [Clostridiales bacterium]